MARDIRIDKDEFIDAYENKTNAYIKDRWGISNDDIYKVLKKCGYSKRKREGKNIVIEGL